MCKVLLLVGGKGGILYVSRFELQMDVEGMVREMEIVGTEDGLGYI